MKRLAFIGEWMIEPRDAASAGSGPRQHAARRLHILGSPEIVIKNGARTRLVSLRSAGKDGMESGGWRVAPPPIYALVTGRGAPQRQIRRINN